MISIEVFEESRPQLVAIAFRLLGSVHEAEDAVQTAWIKTSTVAERELRNPAAFLTTVVTRECFDQLRARQRQQHELVFADDLPSESVAADERYLVRESISRALLVVLARLTPNQRVAYVLHDVFDLPFSQIADILGTNANNAKKHASRGRQRIYRNEEIPVAGVSDGDIVEEFLAAAAGGDMTRMIALLADDCVRTVDPVLVPPGTSEVVVGAKAVAAETVQFADRIRAATPMLAESRVIHVIAPGGHAAAGVTITVAAGRVMRIDISRSALLADLRVAESRLNRA